MNAANATTATNATNASGASGALDQRLRSLETGSTAKPTFPLGGTTTAFLGTAATNRIDASHDYSEAETRDLYESPFTDLAPRGPDELFATPQLDELLGVLDEMRKSALAS